MLALSEVFDLQKDIDDRNFDVDEKIANIRNILFSEDENQLSSEDAKNITNHICDIAIKLKNLVHIVDDFDQSKLQSSIIPEIKLLATELYQKYSNQNDEKDLQQLFYLYSSTYESLLAADNISLATNFLDMAFDVFHKINPTPNILQILCQLKIWEVQNKILHDQNYDEALNILKEFTDQYMIESPHLLSFVYQKAIQYKSIEWCNYCLSLAYSYSSISNEWKNQVESLLAQLYLNNGEPEKAIKLVSILPDSIHKHFLEIKCIILLYPEDKSLKEKLISFISETSEERTVLVALCLFVADHCEVIENAAIKFIKEVMKISHSITNIIFRNHIYVSAIQISCEQNDIDSTSLFLKMISSTDDFQTDVQEVNELKKISNFNTNFIKTDNFDIINEYRTEIAEILWKKANDSFDTGELANAAQWMQFSRGLMSELDNQAQSCCFRFMSCCFFEIKKYDEALKFADFAIQRTPNCSHGYLLKFQIFFATNNFTESNNIIENLISNNPTLLEEFEPEFFFSVSSQLHSIGNDKLSLEILLDFYDHNFNSKIYANSDQNSSTPCSIKKTTINSIFALLQEIDDEIYISKVINRLYSKWKEQIEYKIIEEETENDDFILHFTPSDILAFTSIAFNNGVSLKSKNLCEIAANSFMFAAILSNSFTEQKLSCIHEVIDCYLITKKPSFTPNDSFSNENFPNFTANSSFSDVTKALESLIEESEDFDQKMKDKLLFAKIKKSIFMIANSSEETEDLIGNIIDSIGSLNSPEILHEVCSLICEFRVSHDAVRSLLNRITELPKTEEFTEISMISMAASMLHKIFTSSTTSDDFFECYKILFEFLDEKGSSLMNSKHLQFFMSHAWNFGVENLQSFRLEEADFWFSRAIEIMEMNEELKTFYSDELKGNYSKFLAYKSEPK